MRLKDADALRLLKVNECAGHTIEFAQGWKACIDRINAQPTIDAVPVVRCKDCKYWDKDFPHGGSDFCECKVYLMPMLPDNFCSDGERRESE